MRIPGGGMIIGLFAFIGSRLKDWVMGARESDDSALVLYDRTLLDRKSVV